MYSIPNTIPPLPDELFGSYLDRLASFNACSPHELLECYAGLKNNSSRSLYTMDSCEHPELLISALCLDCSVLDFLSQTSILPALYPLMTSRIQDNSLHSITGDHRLLGRQSALVTDTFYCPKCQQEDIDKYGVAYIHRSHCLPGVRCCNRHHLPLINCKTNVPTTNYVTDIDIKYANFFVNLLNHWINTNYQDLYFALEPLIKSEHDLDTLPEATYSAYFTHGLKSFSKRLTPGATYIAYPSLVMLIMLLFDSFEDFNNYITNYEATEPPLIERTCSDCHTVYFDAPHAISMGWLCPHCSKDMTDTEYVSRYVSSCTNDEYQLIGSFDGMMKPLSLYHKKCGETIPIRARSFIHQGARCDCEHYNTFDSISKNLPDNFELLHFTGNTNDPIIVKSADCGHVFPAHYHKLIKYPGCKECQKQYASENGYKKSVQNLVGDEYTLESTYQNRTQKVQMLHTICNTCMTYAKAYRWMLRKYYSYTEESPNGVTLKTLSAVEVPTFSQFSYFMKNALTQKERDIIKTSVMEYRNNNRLLLSDVMYDVKGPCDRVQMDESELDVSLVSEFNPDQSIGRPIVYAMIDVYTRMILAVGVSFDNNSVLGMTNCLLNLAEDKVKFCAKYGLNITENIWSSGYLPHRILTDRGSEYMCPETKRICNELNITLEPVPAGTGSLKGCVEQLFHQIHSNQNAILEHNGQISKRHDSKHHKESCLTIDEFTTILVNYVVKHNSNIIENYRPEPDMIKENITLSPLSLWKYGCKKYGTPNKIQNICQYCYSLMSPQKATLDRRGITCNGLYYLNADDHDLHIRMQELQNKREKIEVRMDPRDIGSVYYLKDNKLVHAPLNDKKFGNADFAGLTIHEWNTIRDVISAKKREGKITAEEHRLYLDTVIETIVASAKKNYPSSTENMTRNRNFEKYYLQNHNSIYLRIMENLNQELSVPLIAPLDEFSISDSFITEIEEVDVLQETIATTSESTNEDWLQAIENCNNETYNTTNQ